MTETNDGPDGVFNIRNIINREKGSNTNRPSITPWARVRDNPSRFVQNPPLKFQFEDFQGDQIIVRLMKNSEEMIAWNVEIQRSESFSRYYTLYYWKKSSNTQQYVNRQHLLKGYLRWADNMTDTRHDDAIDDYNPIMEMLEEIGINTGEAFE